MRGKLSKVGEKRVTQNGYHQTKCVGGWRYDHHLIAEKILGRPLAKNERAKFKNGDRNDLSEDNIEIVEVQSTLTLPTTNADYLFVPSLESRVARLEEIIENLLARDEMNNEV